MRRDSRMSDMPPTSARSRVGTGRSLFLAGIDGRSLIARRYREVFAQLLTDIGRPPREAEVLIARQVAALAVLAQTMEAQLVAGQAINIGEFTTNANCLRRLLADLPKQTDTKDINPQSSGTLTIEFVESDGDGHLAPQT